MRDLKFLCDLPAALALGGETFCVLDHACLVLRRCSVSIHRLSREFQMLVLVREVFELHAEEIVERRAVGVLDDALGGGEVEFLERERSNICVTILFAACARLYLF